MKIKTTNYEKLNTILDEINGRAGTHTFTGPQLRAAGIAIKKHLSSYMTLSEMKGTTGTIESSEQVPRSYKYVRVGNEATFIVNAKGEVFITAIAKVDLWEKDGGRTKFNFSDDQKASIAARAIETASKI